ncbi:MAG: lytic transglycosylase domain-containing protein [Ruminococcaceae bacterium]|nr:lytic transglycosylase domain-containing protein [Oscillospiraceae bacterium]
MKRKRGCIRPVLMIAFVGLLLYFFAGNGKEFVLKNIYPVKYQDYVERYAEEYSLDKYLVYSVIKVESGFDPEAYSRMGAKGLMQLMDKTASECNEKGNFGYRIPSDLYDPEKNIRLGCFYLSSLYEIYGDMELVITAYNGGTGNVDKWLDDDKLADGKGGLADIPYEETKNYVEKVQRTFEAYNKLYKTNEH